MSRAAVPSHEHFQKMQSGGGSPDEAYQVGKSSFCKQAAPTSASDGNDAESGAVRKALTEFKRLLEDTSAPPFNTIKIYRETLCMTVSDFALEHNYSASRMYGIEAGATASIPRTILETVEILLGAGAACLFEANWQRWRASLAADVKKTLDEKFFINGMWKVE